MVHHIKHRNGKNERRAGRGEGGGRLLTTVQHKYTNMGLPGQRQKVRQDFSLRRAGWTEGGAGGIRAAVVAEGAWTWNVAAAAATAAVGPLQHARLEVRVAAGVLHQVVAAHEALVAQRALELLLARVGAVVASQLIGAGKLLTAVRPGTRERPFSCGSKRKGHVSKSRKFKGNAWCFG